MHSVRDRFEQLGVASGHVLLALWASALPGCSAEAGDEAPLGTSQEAVCATPTLSVSTPSPQTIGTQVTLTASATCDPGGVQYEFAYRASQTSAWTILRPFGTAPSALWNTTGLPSASYALRVRARNTGTTTASQTTTTYVLGTASPCAGAVLVADQSYATHPANKLDLHLPKGFSGSRPLLVWIHGGGWTNGTKTLNDGALNRLCPLVADGFAVASIDYRLTCIPSTCPAGEPDTCEDHVFPAQIHDAKAAVRFLRARAGSFRLAPNRFVSFGASAGGHLSALLGTSGDVPDLEDLTQGNAGVSSRVQGFIDCYGPTRLESMDDELGQGSGHSDGCSPESQLLGCDQGLEACPEDRLLAVSPMTHVTIDDPPALISHGTSDPVVPEEQSEHLRDELEDKGVPVTYRTFDGGHDIKASCPTVSDIQTFLDDLFP